MQSSKFALSCEAYKNKVFAGLTSLQQNGEFVDMTIAADGHLVRVHQILIALASPYLKELVSTTPTPHPVIFLNNVSHRILSLLLEYIYTGEVLIPQDCFSDFIKTAGALQISSLQNAKPEDCLGRNSHQSENDKTTEDTFIESRNNLDRTDNALEISYRQSQINDDDYVVSPGDVVINEEESSSKLAVTSKRKDNVTDLHFTVSNQGCLQVIMNRFIYNYSGVKNKSKWRVWRCSDYQRHRCNAKVITETNKIIQRINPHSHKFHDKRIMDKVKKGIIYATIESVVGVKKHKFAPDDDQSKTNDDIQPDYTSEDQTV